jgi:hypothetical protein
MNRNSFSSTDRFGSERNARGSAAFDAALLVVFFATLDPDALEDEAFFVPDGFFAVAAFAAAAAAPAAELAQPAVAKRRAAGRRSVETAPPAAWEGTRVANTPCGAGA